MTRGLPSFWAIGVYRLPCGRSAELSFSRNPRQSLSFKRAFSAAVKRLKKPYYVTTPIFYVNAAPHVGHLYTLVLADILKRWHVLQGDDKAFLLTGTDEHGMKIQKAAQQADTDVKVFCDDSHLQFKQLAEAANIQYDRFIRTTDADHRLAVEYFWNELERRDYIYKAKHSGWYSVSDETFFPQSSVHLIQDPRTGRKLMTSMETGREVEWTEETNYHFRLSTFKDKLLNFYAENPSFMIPKFRLDEMINDVTNNLEDLSISRPSQRLQWGIRVPGDDTQTIYVWVDALINYITKAGYPFPDRQTELDWPPDCQVIGKDITRFHCIYWPALLMALNLPLPKRFLTHAHWTMNKAKMSKSAGNVVNPFYAIDRFGVDVIRYYMAHDGGIKDDADYENTHIVERYKKGLQGGLGNLASRVMRGKRWSVRHCIESASKGYLLNVESLPDVVHVRFRDHLQTLPETVTRLMDEPNPRAALQTIMEGVYTANRYISAVSPWAMVKYDRDRETVGLIIYLLAESLRLSGILLQPFIPESADRLLDMLGVQQDRRTYQYAQFGADYEYGATTVEVGNGIDSALFPPLISET